MASALARAAAQVAKLNDAAAEKAAQAYAEAKAPVGPSPSKLEKAGAENG